MVARVCFFLLVRFRCRLLEKPGSSFGFACFQHSAHHSCCEICVQILEAMEEAVASCDNCEPRQSGGVGRIVIWVVVNGVYFDFIRVTDECYSAGIWVFGDSVLDSAACVFSLLIDVS